MNTLGLDGNYSRTLINFVCPRFQVQQLLKSSYAPWSKKQRLSTTRGSLVTSREHMRPISDIWKTTTVRLRICKTWSVKTLDIKEKLEHQSSRSIHATATYRVITWDHSSEFNMPTVNQAFNKSTLPERASGHIYITLYVVFGNWGSLVAWW